MGDFFTEESKAYVFEESESWEDLDEMFDERYQIKLSNIKVRNFYDYIRKYMFDKWFKEKVDVEDYYKVSDAYYKKKAMELFKENGVIVGKDTAGTNDIIRKDMEGHPRGAYVNTTREKAFQWFFALGFDLETCEIFMKKALRERSFNPRRPIEVIYYYMFKKGMRYDNVDKIIEKYINRIESMHYEIKCEEIGTEELNTGLLLIETEDDLFRHLDKVLAASNSREGNIKKSPTVSDIKEGKYIQQRAKTVYSSLFDEYVYNLQNYYYIEDDDAGEEVSEIDKKIKLVVKSVEIGFTSKDEEKTKNYFSKLYMDKWEKFFDNRLTEDRIKKRLNIDVEKTDDNDDETPDEGEVTREDIITLSFLNYVYANDEEFEETNMMTPKEKAIDFVQEVDIYLYECGFGPFYYANPFEAFIIFCLLSNAPIDIFKDIVAFTNWTQIWPAYDKDFNRMSDEVLIRGKEIPDEKYHVVINLIVENKNDNKILITKHKAKNDVIASEKKYKNEEEKKNNVIESRKKQKDIKENSNEVKWNPVIRRNLELGNTIEATVTNLYKSITSNKKCFQKEFDYVGKYVNDKDHTLHIIYKKVLDTVPKKMEKNNFWKWCSYDEIQELHRNKKIENTLQTVEKYYNIIENYKKLKSNCVWGAACEGSWIDCNSKEMSKKKKAFIDNVEKVSKSPYNFENILKLERFISSIEENLISINDLLVMEESIRPEATGVKMVLLQYFDKKKEYNNITI